MFMCNAAVTIPPPKFVKNHIVERMEWGWNGLEREASVPGKLRLGQFWEDFTWFGTVERENLG